MLSGSLLYAVNRTNIMYKVLAIVGTVITGVTGAMLYQRFGMPWSGPYPIWITIKSCIWFVIIFALPMAGFKLKEKARHMVWPVIFLIAIAAAVSIYKPL